MGWRSDGAIELALYQERGVKPRRVDAAQRVWVALLSRLFNWRDALVVVRPETLIRRHRAGWRLFWRCNSRPGRPPIPLEPRQLIRRMATENPPWGEERTTPAHSDSEPTPLLPGETRRRESAHFGERLSNAIGLSLGKHCDRAAREPFLRNRPHLANQEIGVLVKLRPCEDTRPKWHGGASSLEL